jgi:hypothetical protein
MDSPWNIGIFFLYKVPFRKHPVLPQFLAPDDIHILFLVMVSAKETFLLSPNFYNIMT